MEQLDLFDRPVPPVITILTFNQAFRLFLSIYWSKVKMHKKTGACERYLVAFFDGCLIHTIGRQDVENMRRYLAVPGNCSPDGLGISAVNKCHTILARMFNKLEDWKEDGWCAGYDFSKLALPRRNPGLQIKKVKEPAGTRFITPWEFRKIHQLCRKVGDQELADMIRFGIWARLSPIDLENLNDDEINEERFQIEIRRRHTKTTKNPQGCLQVIPLTERMWGLIARYRKFRRPGEKRIFNAWNRINRLRKVRKLAVAQGIKDFTWLDLRRSGSGYLHEKGVDLETRADGLGHSTTRMTKAHYTPPTKPHLKRSSQLLVEAF